MKILRRGALLNIVTSEDIRRGPLLDIVTSEDIKKGGSVEYCYK